MQFSSYNLQTNESSRSKLLRAILCAMVFYAAAFGQSTVQIPTSPSDTRTKEIVEAMVKANNGWGKNLNASGAVLKLVETGRLNGRISYRLHAVGMRSDLIYSLIQWPVTQRQPSVALRGVTIDRSGTAVCAGRPGTCGEAAKPDDPIELQTAPVQGEPLRFALVAEDDPTVQAAVKLVPLPNSSVDKGCRVDTVLLMPHAELLSVEASGFPANAEVTLTESSEGEIHNAQQKTDGAGKSVWALLPAKAGLKNGLVTIQVKAPGCNPQLSAKWGTQ